MTNYREILRLCSLNLKTDEIVRASGTSSKTVVKARKRAAELGLSWPLPDDMTEMQLEDLMFPKPEKQASTAPQSNSQISPGSYSCRMNASA